jgi:hypothetical protein
MSPISSRKIVPPCASSNLPRRSATAPVKAPRTWPNSSISISSSGMAEAERVNSARHQFLPRSVLAEDEHAAVGRRRHRHLLAQAHHPRTVAHHRVLGVNTRAQREVLRLEVSLA